MLIKLFLGFSSQSWLKLPNIFLECPFAMWRSLSSRRMKNLLCGTPLQTHLWVAGWYVETPSKIIVFEIKSNYYLTPKYVKKMVLVQSLGVQNSLGSMWPRSNSVEKGLGVPMGIKLNMNKQCAAAVAKKGNRMLGCINNHITSRNKKAIFLLLLSACHTTHAFLFSGLVPTKQRYVGRLKKIHRRVTKMIQGLRSCHMRTGWEKWVCSILGKGETLWGDPVTLSHYLKCGYKKVSKDSNRKGEGHDHKLPLKRIWLDRRGKLFTMPLE